MPRQTDDQHDPGPLPDSSLGLPPDQELAQPPGFQTLAEYPSAQTHPDSPAAASGSEGPGSPGSGAGPQDRSPTITVPRGKAAAYKKIAQAGFKALGGLINLTISAGTDSDAFVPDDDDLDTVAPPLGRLAARHVPLGKASEHMTDVEDLGMAAVGLVAWGLKGAASWWEARRSRPRIPKGSGTVVQPEDTNPGAQA